MRICVENVRSFFGSHEVALKPLNFLIGENSSGKSTFLATTHLALSGGFLSFSPNFNDAPYDMGNFETISSNAGTRTRKGKYFSIGYKSDLTESETIIASFSNQYGESVLCSLKADIAGSSVAVTIAGDRMSGKATIVAKDNPALRGESEFALDLHQRKTNRNLPFPSTAFLIHAQVLRNNKQISETPELNNAAFNFAIALSNASGVRRTPFGTASVISLSPLRTRPERVYGETAGEFTPAGDHIPYVLARLNMQHDHEYEVMLSTLREFGKESGLFKSVHLKKLVDKKDVAGPFQVQIHIAGPRRNLTDVGYGISQSLPIIVETVRSAPGSYMLIQQPEVHLHPRAQAGLGTFFAKTAAANRKNFLIETHSDYMIDRVRREIAQGTIKANDCQILYFERKALTTKIHPIYFDDVGNVVDAPRGYRKFFMEENSKNFNRSQRISK